KRYIFGKRNGIYIIDLQKAVKLLDEACDFARELGRAGRRILFVGTKRQAQEVIQQEAERCGQFHVTNRWLGGTLTNFVTIRSSVERLQEIEDRLGEEDSPMTKKERLRLERERERLHGNLAGIREMEDLPDALFVVDPKREHIAIAEANALDVPVIGIVDTNCDPELIDYIIPGNDDAIRTIRLFASRVADAYLAGARELSADLEKRAKDAAREAAAREAEAKDAQAKTERGKRPSAVEEFEEELQASTDFEDTEV
ncbi:MAG: 30S ribosomal protein S2, partial [Thermoanaerobaculia bacterium]